jgi:ABC-type multidrug transport system fused ATPase/permease subunit
MLAEPEMKRPNARVSLNETGIRLTNVSFAYGDTLVISGLNLGIPVNEVTALVDPSGGGKSTIAKL